MANELVIDAAYGELLPDDKVQALKNQGLHITFVGDGVNDAPVIALADVVI